MKRTQYDEAFKRNAVGLVDSGAKAAQVARDLGVHVNQIYGWCHQYRKTPSTHGNLQENRDDEVTILKRELARKTAELDILKSDHYLCSVTPASKTMKFQFISKHLVPYSIALQCEVLAVSPSGYYRWLHRPPSKRAEANAELVEHARAIHANSRRSYGSPRMTIALRREGYRCSRNRVARLMRLDGLQARTRRAFCRTTISDHAKASPNLLDRQFAVELPGQAWTSDITYVATQEGWLYVASVMDLCTRRVVGTAMQSHMKADLVIEALEQAIGRYQPKPGLLLHSDRGSQYSSEAYRELIAEQGFRQSMSRRGNCWDNAPMESFFKTMKVECVYEQTYETRQEAQRSIFEYIEVFYNRQRLHSALNFQSPETFEAKINHSHLNAPKQKSTLH